MKTLSILAAIAMALWAWNQALIKWIIYQRQNRLVPALIAVESSGDDKAFNAATNAHGPLQLTEAYIADSGITCLHPYNREDAIIIFRAYMSRYAKPEILGRIPTMEDMARIHNGGPDGWKRKSTEAYWKKVKAQL